MKFLDNNNILSDSQHGFRAERSTETQLLLTINDITKHVDKNSTVSMAILDFAKAFDKVPHRRLLSKLSAYGFNNNRCLYSAESKATKRFTENPWNALPVESVALLHPELLLMSKPWSRTTSLL